MNYHDWIEKNLQVIGESAFFAACQPIKTKDGFYNAFIGRLRTRSLIGPQFRLLISIESLFGLIERSQRLRNECLIKTERALKDRFYALRHIRGDDFTDQFIEIAKTIYIKQLFNPSTPLNEARCAANKKLWETLDRTCPQDVKAILSFRNFIKLGDILEKFYFSEEEKSRARMFDVPTNRRGQILAVPVKTHNISGLSLEAFARHMAASETGVAAQARNPRPRIENSRDKMNRDGGPV